VKKQALDLRYPL